jgi:hypothetical protein
MNQLQGLVQRASNSPPNHANTYKVGYLLSLFTSVPAYLILLNLYGSFSLCRKIETYQKSRGK